MDQFATEEMHAAVVALTDVVGSNGDMDMDSDDDVPRHDALMDADYDGVDVGGGVCLSAGDANEDVNDYHSHDYEHGRGDDSDETEVTTQSTH